MDRKKWKSPQALIVMALIFLIFLYIGIDMGKVKPEIKRDLKEVKKEYTELSGFLDRKIPEIDSILRIQATQIPRQGEDIDSLNSKVNSITSR